MFSSLLRNIAITGVAYAIISAVGLVLAPVFIAAFGLAGYGQILLARIFLPSAAFGLLDLGVGENTTRIVASARAHGQWDDAGKGLSIILPLALAMAAALAVALALLAPQVSVWMSIEQTQHAGFVFALRVTAAAMPVLFLSLVAEGVLKGFEEFKQLRSCEVASAIIYAGLSLSAIALGYGPNTVALALLAGLCVRALMAGWWAVELLRRTSFRLQRTDVPMRREILAWTGTMLFNKMIGTMQMQVQGPLLGLLAGPAAVGLFDAIVRLPRFAKSIFSLISVTVMPLAARLRAQQDNAATRKLAHVGMLGAFMACTPPAAMAAAYSYSILEFWLGHSVSPYWEWQAIMFAVPVLNIMVGFGGSILLADRPAVIALNRLSLAQATLQIAISLAMLEWLEPWSFVLGQVASMLVVVPFQLALIRRHLDLPGGMGWRMLLVAASSAGIGGLLYLIEPRPGLIMLLILFGIGTALGWLAAPFLAMDRAVREIFFRLVRERLGPIIARLDSKRRGPEGTGDT